jgi:hypothetical protein
LLSPSNVTRICSDARTEQDHNVNSITNSVGTLALVCELNSMMCVCCRVSGVTQQTPVKITILVNMVAYAFQQTVDLYVNAETSTLKGYFARKVGDTFQIYEKE